jgi:hypothetical protein
MSPKALARSFIVVSVFAALLASSPFVPGTASAQMDAGYLADVQDLKVAVTYSRLENQTDVSLALVPPVPAGGPGVTLMFRARFRGRTADVDRLAGIVVRAHYRLLSDDRPRSSRSLMATHALHMNLDPQGPRGITLPFFPASWGSVGFTAPGDEIPVAFFTVTPADLRALAIARTVTGDVLWTNFVLTPPQLDALRTFARHVLPAGSVSE